MSQRATPGDTRGVHPEAKQRDDAEAKMNAAPIKQVSDLPDDHPMRRRQEMMGFVDDAHQRNEGNLPPAEDTSLVDVDADPDTAAAEAARKELEAQAAKDAAAQKEAEAKEGSKQVEAQTKEKEEKTEEVVLDAASLSHAKVKVVIDGVEELVPASKVLAQYQKGGAADVKLANAVKLEREARAAADKIVKDAQQSATHATTATERAEAQTSVEAAQKAQAKFKEASDALILGETETAAKLFGEAVAIAQTPLSTGRTDSPTLDMDEVVRKTIAGTKQQLDQDGALKQLFTDYPEIKAKRAFAIMADEYISAYQSAGESLVDAIAHAGETLGEEYGLGKQKTATPAPSGRRLNSGAPTTRQEKLDAKKELDNVPSGNARTASQEAVEPSAQQTIAEMAAARDPSLRRAAA